MNTIKRKRLSERQVIDVLIGQGVVIRCPKSGRLIERGSDTIREHLHQLGLGGKDVIENMQFWHKDASHLKTHGTKATSYGSDAHARAKAKRIALRAQCPKHPFYEAKRAPKVDCEVCQAIWDHAKRRRPFKRKPK